MHHLPIGNWDYQVSHILNSIKVSFLGLPFVMQFVFYTALIVAIMIVIYCVSKDDREMKIGKMN